jgi:hypothetical protein
MIGVRLAQISSEITNKSFKRVRGDHARGTYGTLGVFQHTERGAFDHDTSGVCGSNQVAEGKLSMQVHRLAT